MKLITELKDYQKETKDWISLRESQGKGGMILLEAGLGKTLTMLSCIEGRTLIIAPAAVLNVWIKEIEKHTIQSSYYRYYGKDKTPENKQVILTTYGTLLRSFDEKIVGCLGEKFERIILDEGHYIRNQNTKIAKAVLELRGRYKWILTATPILNNINEAYMYFRFTELEGIDSYGDWRNLVKSNTEGIILLKEMLSKNSIRFKKSEVLKDLVPKKELEIELEFSKEERELYDAIREYSLTRLKKLSVKYNNTEGQIKRRIGATILTLILRLKQCCSSSYLAMIGMKRIRRHGIKNRKEGIKMLKFYTESKENNDECPVCMDSEGEQIAECGHKCCKKCWEAIFNTSSKCPICRKKIYENELENIKEPVQQKQSSYKIKDLESTKTKWIQAKIKELLDKGEKVIIVSQWTQTLEIIQKIMRRRLKIKESEEIYLVGGISVDKKSKMIDEFQANPEVKVCYLSMLGNGEGITLTKSSKMIMADKWWNRGKEEQVKERIHRIGQENQVEIFNLEIVKTIEKQIHQLGEKKERIARMVLGEMDIHTEENEAWVMKVIKLIENS